MRIRSNLATVLLWSVAHFRCWLSPWGDHSSILCTGLIIQLDPPFNIQYSSSEVCKIINTPSVNRNCSTLYVPKNSKSTSCKINN
ncbi:hypothetical protein EDD16DRAFT_1648705 [Pisolithus croceorrhizus]|nr:hypothetical protein EDD16DRAFT_1648705 [Pisolithus croceorrhizus]KAI6120217.1 hypothetical protein EV401DRAFT_1423667 [Pisolithus croceorrhizus]